MWPDDGLEMWERDGYAEAMYEKADNDRKALKENGEANSAKNAEIRKGTDGASLFPDGYPEFAADTVESLREWVMDNEVVPDAEFRCSKRQAMALVDTCDGLFRGAGSPDDLPMVCGCGFRSKHGHCPRCYR